MAESSDTENTAASRAVPDEQYSGFSEGDLGRLQGILFGDHAKQTHERIDTLERALLGAMSDLQAEIADQLAAIEKRLVAEEENRAVAVNNVADRLAVDTKDSANALKKFQQDVAKDTAKLNKALEDAVTDQRLELDATRRDLTAQIEASEAALSDSSVDRNQLAAALVNIADELKR